VQLKGPLPGIDHDVVNQETYNPAFQFKWQILSFPKLIFLQRGKFSQDNLLLLF
jgi:hypothetical protein